MRFFNNRMRLTVAYDGTDFFGWQKQKKADQPSVQDTLEKMLSQIYQKPIQVIGSGRTDRGVHAKAQVCHFDLPESPNGFDLLYKLNKMSPENLSLLKLEWAPDRFHSQLWARKKHYEYFVQNRPFASPFLRRYSLHHPWPLDLELLNRYAEAIVGLHDFKSFQTTGTVVPDTVREIFTAKWAPVNSEGLISFQITGSGFLKQMVRNLVGTMLDLHKDQAPPEAMQQILEQKDRQAAGKSAAPQGLFMVKVEYEPSVDRLCKPIK